MGRILIIGDSLTVQCQDRLLTVADSLGADIVVDALIGRSIQGAPIILRHRGEFASVVVALGTNDVGPATVTVEGWIEETVAECPEDTALWWVDVCLGDGRGQRVNTALERVKNRHRRLKILSWADVVAGHSDALDADGIHLSETGARLRAELITRAVVAESPGDSSS